MADGSREQVLRARKLIGGCAAHAEAVREAAVFVPISLAVLVPLRGQFSDGKKVSGCFGSPPPTNLMNASDSLRVAAAVCPVADIRRWIHQIPIPERLQR